MAVNIRLYSFGKKPNSTKIPDAQTVENETFECLFKEPFSLLNPVILLKHDNPAKYNYAYIGKFGRYYFINNWEYDKGIWYGYLNVDVLASWKTEIGESEQYVLRSASNYDETIIDTLYPCFSGEALITKSVNNPWARSFDTGYVVIGIANSDTANSGFVNYYVFDNDGVNKLKSFLLGDSGWFTLDIDEISANLQKELFNPLQYISSCLWFPVEPPQKAGGDIDKIKFGWWELSNQKASTLFDGGLTQIDSVFDVPQHPQQETRGSFLQRTSDYSEFILLYPPFGEITIPAELLTNTAKLYIRVIIDFITGSAELMVSPFESFKNIIIDTFTQLAVPLQISQINNQPFSAAANLVGGLFNIGVSGYGMQFGNKITKTGFIQNLGNSFLDSAVGTTKSLAPNISTTGANGSLSRLLFDPQLKARFKILVDEDISHFGRPYCKSVKIQTLSGFLKCNGADISTTATQTENDMITEYLNGGLFYE